MPEMLHRNSHLKLIKRITLKTISIPQPYIEKIRTLSEQPAEKTVTYHYICPSIMSTSTTTKEKSETSVLTLQDEYCRLIIWNDEVNTFDWVIQALMEVCGHSQEQAEQCAIIIDSKGKYAVKEGDYDTLKPMCDAITERGINATIEVTAY